MQVNIHFKGRRGDFVINAKIITFEEVADEKGTIRMFAKFLGTSDDTPIGSVDVRAIRSVTETGT